MRKLFSYVMLMAVGLLISGNAGAKIWSVTTIEGINAALADGTFASGDIIQLQDDINYGAVSSTTGTIVTINEEKEVVIDLNGCTMSGAGLHYDSETFQHRYLFLNKGNLTIKNGTICDTKTTNSTFARLMRDEGTKFVAENCTITVEKGICCQFAGTSNAILNNCHFISNGGSGSGGANDNAAMEFFASGNEGTLTVNSGEYIGGSGGAIFFYLTTDNTSALLTINNGVFKTDNAEGASALNLYQGPKSQCVVKGGKFSTLPENEVLSQGVTYELKDDMFEIISWVEGGSFTANSASELMTYLSKANKNTRVTVTLGADIDINNQVVTLQHGSTLVIPAGKTLNINEGGVLNNQGIVTNNGTIAVKDRGYLTKPASVTGGTLTGYANCIKSQTEEKITFEINAAMDLQWMSYLSKQNPNVEWDVKMMKDITMPNESFESVPTFKGVFDGQGHSIHNLHLTQITDKGAIFLHFNGGTIKNVNIDAVAQTHSGNMGIVVCDVEDENVCFENITTNGSITATGKTFGMGALFGGTYNGKNDYVIQVVNCVNNANISFPNGYNCGAFIGSISGEPAYVKMYNLVNNGDVTGGLNAGQFIGYGSGKGANYYDFIACTNNGTITPNKTSQPEFGAKGEDIDKSHIDATQYVAVANGVDGTTGFTTYEAREIGEIETPSDATEPWHQTTTWSAGTIIPSAADKAVISHNVHVEKNQTADANKVSLSNNATLTVKEGAILNIGNGGLDVTNGNLIIEKDAVVRVDGAVVGINNENIHITSNETGTSIFAVNPNYPTPADMTGKVELYTTARKGSDTYTYNYIGIPTSTSITASTLERVANDGSSSTTMYLYGWDVVNGWQQGGWELMSKPFRGIAMTNESATGIKFTFKGKLVGNEVNYMQFNHKGFHFFANSYTAPMNIYTLLNSFDANVRATVYVYDSQNNRLEGISRGDFEGYITPQFQVIPSMQAFFVFTEEKSTFTEKVDYLQTVWNNTASNMALLAPARNADNQEFDRISINVSAANNDQDRVYLIAEDQFSADFENGYDAVKLMNRGMNLYVKTAAYDLQNMYSDQIEGTFLSFTSNATDNTYTLTFDEQMGTQYFLKDLMTGIVTPMDAMSSYTFTQPAGQTIDNRFEVVAQSSVVTDLPTVQKGAAPTGIYSVSGQFMGGIDRWHMLPKGVYVVDGHKLIK